MSYQGLSIKNTFLGTWLMLSTLMRGFAGGLLILFILMIPVDLLSSEPPPPKGKASAYICMAVAAVLGILLNWLNLRFVRRMLRRGEEPWYGHRPRIWLFALFLAYLLSFVGFAYIIATSL